MPPTSIRPKMPTAPIATILCVRRRRRLTWGIVKIPAGRQRCAGAAFHGGSACSFAASPYHLDKMQKKRAEGSSANRGAAPADKHSQYVDGIEMRRRAVRIRA